MTRKFFVGGNWKMNGDSSLIDSMSSTLNQLNNLNDSVEIVIAPPFPYLSAAKSAVSSSIGVSAQNCFYESKGAYTGEVSVNMLKDLQIDWVILGHSERREIFKEDDAVVAQKVQFAIKNGIKVIACIGEKLDEREANKTLEVVTRQLKAIADKLSPEDWSSVVIAYEPVWAIGTGKVATPDQAQEVHVAIRKWLNDNVSTAVAETTRIIYGGSVNAGNCKELQKEADIDGFLVGGASLKPADFSSICSCRL